MKIYMKYRQECVKWANAGNGESSKYIGRGPRRKIPKLSWCLSPPKIPHSTSWVCDKILAWGGWEVVTHTRGKAKIGNYTIWWWWERRRERQKEREGEADKCEIDAAIDDDGWPWQYYIWHGTVFKVVLSVACCIIIRQPASHWRFQNLSQL